MAELRARHPSSPPKDNQMPGPNYAQNSYGHNFNHSGQSFHIQGVHYPQNHNINSASSYVSQQNYPNVLPSNSRPDNLLQESAKNNDVREDPIEEEGEIKNKETLQFEEALKQWVNR
ncbi:unnamed protein product [Phaedon cochleariae]|uniref:Uncharacterized protein n=1 Tax=Phaedon cochleariae TaxID=80249 RepID=A0A9N9X3I5_PHACE|nr:unnamed protein product [Phaedon cochleariae]